MPFEYLANEDLQTTRDEFYDRLLECGFAPRTQQVTVREAMGKITAAPVYAHMCAPHYHASAMDGVALLASVTFGASETDPVVVPSDRYVRVDTGDPLPEGCDAVVMIEDVLESDDGSIRLLSAVVPWQNVRQIGEDICAGEMVAPSHTLVTPAIAGALLASGVLSIEVFCDPVVGIIPTGDEIVPPSENPQPGDVMEFNSTIFSGLIEQWGGTARVYPIVPDKPDLIRDALSDAVEKCDVVLLGAGSSAGRDDYSVQIIGQVGEVVCHGLAIKPGKPAILGVAVKDQGAAAVIGVPGYPVSGVIVLEELLRPLMARLTGRTLPEPSMAHATLSRKVVSGLKYQEYVRVRLGEVDGRLVASPIARGAGTVTSLIKADGMLVVPQDVEGYEAGTEVDVRLMRDIDDVRRALVVTGSHDPLIDEVAELMRRIWPDAMVSSTHVGSMGAILAAGRREMHLGGVHLLDAETGTYNIPYLKKHFPDGGVRLVECVQRVQGLMVAAGNPRAIQGIDDLSQEGLRYVNRQKGSGTRVLCDYLLNQHAIDADRIYGYDREEFTHTAVAALVASDSADAGMGIYSAAKLYDLDFVPICLEQYDLLIPDYAWDLPAVQRFLEVLRSPEFRARLEQLGGYELDRPGTVRAHL